MRKKIVISMVVAALLLIGIMATSVLASNTTLARNTDVSNQLRANAISVAPQKLDTVQEVSPASVNSYGLPPSVTPAEVEELPVDAVDKLEEIDVENLGEMEVDDLKEMVPGTYEEADAQICRRVRFLLYTHDGKHVMWGFVGNGYFVGEDNLGKRCWGIYGKGIFAGFYDGGFFWGKYRCGNWKAMGVFGENYTHGKYILFPEISTDPAITATRP